MLKVNKKQVLNNADQDQTDPIGSLIRIITVCIFIGHQSIEGLKYD